MAAPADAGHEVCGDREGIVKQLAERYGERPVWRGLDYRGQLVELFASKSGTWTIIVTVPGMPSCLVAGGEGSQPLEPPPSGKTAS